MKPLTLIPLLFCLMLLAACASPVAQAPESLYSYKAWPAPIGVERQSGVARYLTKGHSAYKSCTVNMDILKGSLS